jgi:predicted enzyme related to lactoylglutathione lyase
MKVIQILSRIYVTDIDAAIRFYEELFQEKCSSRFGYPQVKLEIARVRDILLIGGSEEALKPFRDTTATFLVDSVDEFKAFLLQNGATLIRDIRQVPTGLNMTLRHKDGTLIEYVEHKKVNTP